MIINELFIHINNLVYLYIRHCKIKFNIYLLYSTRPKNETKHYSIHIDIYEKNSLVYRGSFFSSILKFPFLPVHRIALQLNIHVQMIIMKNCIDHQCIHGQCVQYSNTQNLILHFVNVKKDGLENIVQFHTNVHVHLIHYVLVSYQIIDLLCICPLNKWGHQCLLRSMVCQLNKHATCFNGGTCISIDENIISEKKFLCICSKGFSGDQM